MTTDNDDKQIIYWTRPFEGMNDMEKARWGMENFQELYEVNEEDGMTFANKTAMWVAYERQLESERPEGQERLFCDPLAKFFAQPYGKHTSDVFACIGSQSLFDPNSEIEQFEHEGYTAYHAARTKLVSVQFKKWLAGAGGAADQNEKQIINVGAGADTRAFWDDSLQDASLYVEVDDVHVQNAKQKVLNDAKSMGQLPDMICPRKVVPMNFADNDESIKDLPTKYGIEFPNDKPTCWLLEGLIMYLDQGDVDRLLEEISTLTAHVAGSRVILNFSDGGEEHRSAKYCRKFLEKKGWKHDQTVYFGDEDFSFGRYPKGKKPNETLGFSYYSR